MLYAMCVMNVHKYKINVMGKENVAYVPSRLCRHGYHGRERNACVSI